LLLYVRARVGQLSRFIFLLLPEMEKLLEAKLDKLDDHNYGVWEARVQMYLDMADVSDVVHIGILDDATESARKKDKQARAFLGAHVSNQYLSLFKKSATAKAFCIHASSRSPSCKMFT
jgi:hypothetical protein